MRRFWVDGRQTGSYPETGLEEINGDVPEADLNEAALRRTLSRVSEPTVEVI
jgi:hypothetical protein